MVYVRVSIMFWGFAPLVLCNNPLVPGVGMADPHPHVFNSTHVVLYAGHDAGGPNSTTWDMPDWRVWTSTDLVEWTLERVLTPGVGALASWNISQCFATDSAMRVRPDGSREYFLYFSNHTTDIGVLRSSSPTGPWEDVLKAPLFPADTTGRGN